MNENIGRKNGLRMPNIIENIENNKETYKDKTEISKGVSEALEIKYKEEKEITEEHKDSEKGTKIPSNSSELIVITKTKKLAAYVITITEKSPKRFRAVYAETLSLR